MIGQHIIIEQLRADVERLTKLHGRELLERMEAERERDEWKAKHDTLADVSRACIATAERERDERAERIGRAVLDVMVSFAHPAYGPVGTLRGMAAILRKPHHGPFDQTPALLDAIADAMEEP